MARLGPIEPDQISLAVLVYKSLYNQHAQLLDATVRIAGPALNPVGSTPSFPAMTRTYSWCFDDKSFNSGWNDARAPGTVLGTKPSESNYRWSPPNAGSDVCFYMERFLVGPFTVIDSDWIFQENIGNGQTWSSDAAHTMASVKSFGYLTRTLEVKFEITTGYGASKVTNITNWGVFVTTIALPLLNTYQTVLRNIADRLKATAIIDPVQRKDVWTMLLSCSVDVTDFTLDKLEVLRDPTGSPVYLPPASVSTVRDAMMTSVVDSYKVIRESSRFQING